MTNKIGNKKYDIWNLLILLIISMILLLPTTTIGSTSNHDDDTPEIFINEIISPPSHGKTGNYDVTVSFTAVGIIINGSRDYNEPWIEHEESPDNDADPNINFYTSCDEENMYIAFENQTDGVLAGEIFIDKNMNGTWDGPSEDNFFTIDYLASNKNKVKDHNGDIVPNSLVEWGDKSFVEVKIPKTNWSICNDWAYRVRSTPLGNSDCNSISLPSNPVTMSVVVGSNSYFITILSDVPLDYDVTNGDYLGWCVDEEHSISNGIEYPVYLWCSYNPLIPWPDDDWDMVNYLINHKNSSASKEDIQDAIWYFVDGENYPADPEAASMVDDALANGEGFMPSIGEWCAILCDAGEGVQKTFIEVQVPADDNGWNPSWGNNIHPSTTPPNGKFLTFTCDYGFNCQCGVAFKAYTDIFKINSGECSTIYETDFENLFNVTCDWKAESLDTNPDTWNLSENRSSSSTHSFHCTHKQHYYGNAFDILEMRKPVDLSNATNVSFSFWHWCKGDTYTSNGYTGIVDYGDIEIYAKNFTGDWIWISLSDLGISNLYYDNNWIQTTIKIEKSNFYPLDGENISGEQLLTNSAKFRFVWKSSPQFQYEGWYIDDIEIKVCKDEWYNPDQPIWQGWEIICMPLGSTITHTFPLQWNANEEGKYLIRVCFQEERPWHSPVDAPCLEKIVTIGDAHDIAVTSLKALSNIDKGEDLHIEATIKNVGTYDESNVQVKATIKREEDGTTVWQETVIISTLNVSDKVILDFTWEDATYCNHILEVRAILPEDEIPENNSKSKTVIVATTIFEDHMNNSCNWDHYDLTGGEGHWNICTSGDDNYLWCGIPETTKYGNNWNDVAMTKHFFDLSSSQSRTLLIFNSSYRMNQSDYGYVEISPDGGRHWEIISDFTGYSDWKSYTYDISAYNTNNVKIRFRFFSNESTTNRGWILDNVIVTNETSIFFNDDFESDTGQWIIERQKAGDWWQRVKKEKSGDTNNMAWWCGDETSGIYPSNLDNVLTLNKQCINAIDFSKAFDASVLFSTWYNISEGDLGILEISDNDGATWNVIGSITGKSLGWTSKLYNIKEYVGGGISIRFRFISDNTNESEGWYIDDFKIVAKFDFDPPETTCTLSGTMGKDDWYVSTVQITLTAVDDYTGVKHIYYKLLDDGIGVQTTYTSPITVLDGNYTIEYWSEDNIGNIEAHHGPTPFKIDSVNPSVNITRPDGGIYWRDHKLWPLTKWTLFEWTKSLIIRDITIIAGAQDSTSGVDYVEFYIDSGSTPMSTDSNEPFEWNWDETVFFTHTITVKAYDKAGNMDSMSKDVKIFNINLFGG